MVRIDLSHETIFGNEDATDEREDIFTSYAVERTEVARFLDPTRPISIVRAYKGEGKSALLRLTSLNLRTLEPQPLVISTAATSMVPELEQTDSDRWVRGWKSHIMKLAANEIGANIGFAFRDDAIALVEEAESNGFRRRSFVSTVTDRLRSSAVPVERTRQGVGNPEQLLRRWGATGSPVWFIIDDIDQNFENTPRDKVKVASFFIAIRQIANLVPEFRFRLTIRPNVWAIIKPRFEGLAVVEQYIEDLVWSQDDYYEFLAKRVEGYLRRTNQWHEVEETLQGSDINRRKQLINLIFTDPMPWGKDQSRHAAVVLCSLSRHRPRWTIELCKKAAKAANKKGRNQITFEDITGELEAFGKRRIEDTLAEFRVQCSQLEELLTAFEGEPEWYSTADLFIAIKKRILAGESPKIEGVMGTPSDMEIAHFLYQIGFLTARKDLPDGDYEHIAFAQNPALLSSRTNIDQGHSWEVHPVFRQALKLKNVRRDREDAPQGPGHGSRNTRRK